jgi:copper chaperone CopZ
VDRHTYTVTGMSCAHCARSVIEEITAIDGVTDVTVDLDTGAVAVASARPLEEAQVRAAVEEAGYELAA